jgi:protein gp37
MSCKSSIEWTEYTWNPVTGCTKISPGCKNCYAERMSRRLQAMGLINYINRFDLTIQPKTLEIPFKWKKPAVVFVNSMSDLFHEDVPFDFIKKVFTVMRNTPLHQYQILTKRAKRLAELSPQIDWPDNVWMGVSVENADYKFRIDCLRNTGAKTKFISIEPMLDRVGRLNLKNINWVIVGGESGPGARPIKEEWVIEVRDQCLVSGVAFFFKQWGGFNKKKAGRMLDGKIWDEMPDILFNKEAPSLLNEL